MANRSRKTDEKGKEMSENAAAVVPGAYWEELAARETEVVCRNASVKTVEGSLLEVPFLGSSIRVDGSRRRLWRPRGRGWESAVDPDLERIVLLYLLGASSAAVLHEWVGVGDLKVAHFFRGPHALKTAPLVDRYGENPDGFSEAAAALGGEPLDMADRAFRFDAFPKVPLAYLYWMGDEDFPAEFTVLFDRSVEAHLAGDAIWGTVNIVTDALSGLR